jgi:hypothetical protein
MMSLSLKADSTMEMMISMMRRKGVQSRNRRNQRTSDFQFRNMRHHHRLRKEPLRSPLLAIVSLLRWRTSGFADLSLRAIDLPRFAEFGISRSNGDIILCKGEDLRI